MHHPPAGQVRQPNRRQASADAAAVQRCQHGSAPVVPPAAAIVPPLLPPLIPAIIAAVPLILPPAGSQAGSRAGAVQGQIKNQAHGGPGQGRAGLLRRPCGWKWLCCKGEHAPAGLPACPPASPPQNSDARSTSTLHSVEARQHTAHRGQPGAPVLPPVVLPAIVALPHVVSAWAEMERTGAALASGSSEVGPGGSRRPGKQHSAHWERHVQQQQRRRRQQQLLRRQH